MITMTTNATTIATVSNVSESFRAYASHVAPRPCTSWLTVPSLGAHLLGRERHVTNGTGDLAGTRGMSRGSLRAFAPEVTCVLAQPVQTADKPIFAPTTQVVERPGLRTWSPPV